MPVIIVHGDNQDAIQEFIETEIRKLGDPSTADLNFTRLSGEAITLNDLRSAVLAVPFLADHRLVVVENALAPFSRRGGKNPDDEEEAETQNVSASQRGKMDKKKFLELLDALPESTVLLLSLWDAPFKRGKLWEWDVLTEKHWLVKWGKAEFPGESPMPAIQRPGFALPQLRDMPVWIQKRVQREGGQISPQAASALANQVGNDTRMASNEIIKLLTYVNFERPVELEDVDLLTAQMGQADIFEMVDAMGSGNGRLASRDLHILLDQQEPIQIFGMVVRQFRLLLQVREALDEGIHSQALAGELHLHPFVAEKLAGQARRFTLERLEDIYHRLLKMDEESKSGGAPLDVSMDTLIAALSR